MAGARTSIHPVVDRAVFAADAARLSRRVVWVAALLCAAGLAVEQVVPDAGAAVRTGEWVLVAAGLLAGVPHGALDHRLVASASGRRPWQVATVYAAVAAATAAALLAPLPVHVVAIIAVLGLSAWHFLDGEVENLTESAPGRARAVVVAAATCSAGVLLVAVARADASLIAVAGHVSPVLLVLGEPVVRLAALALWLGAAAVVLVHGVWTADRRLLVDLAALAALAALAPPLVAFAVWFGGWHALRHHARLIAGDLAAGPPTSPALAVRAHLRAAAPTTAAVLVAVAIVTAVVLGSASPAESIALVLLVLLALTVPHMVSVAWLTARRPSCPSTGLVHNGDGTTPV